MACIFSLITTNNDYVFGSLFLFIDEILRDIIAMAWGPPVFEKKFHKLCVDFTFIHVQALSVLKIF